MRAISIIKSAHYQIIKLIWAFEKGCKRNGFPFLFLIRPFKIMVYLKLTLLSKALRQYSIIFLAALLLL